MSEPLTPGSPEWAAVVSASKVAGILGLSLYESPRSVWHTMRGDVARDDSKNANAKARGHYLEPGVLAWWRDRHPKHADWQEQVQGSLHLVDETTAITDQVWAVATPDAKCVDEFGNVCVIDAKTVNDTHALHWGRPGTDEVPAYYYVSTLWQFACHPDAQIAYVVALFGSPRFDFAEYVIERREDEVQGLIEVCWEFYQSLSGEPPELDDSVATHDIMRRLHPEIDHGAVVELERGEAAAFVRAAIELEAAEAASRRSRAAVLERMGRARIARHAGLVIARRQPHRHGGVSLVVVTKDLEGIES